MTSIIFDHFTILLTKQWSCEARFGHHQYINLIDEKVYSVPIENITLDSTYHAKDLFDGIISAPTLKQHVKEHGNIWKLKPGFIAKHICYHDKWIVFCSGFSYHHFEYEVKPNGDDLHTLSVKLNETMALVKHMACALWKDHHVRISDDGNIYYTYHDKLLQAPLPYPCLVETIILSHCNNVIVKNKYTIYDISNTSMINQAIDMIKKNNWTHVKNIIIKPSYSVLRMTKYIPDEIQSEVKQIKEKKLTSEQVEFLESYNVETGANICAYIKSPECVNELATIEYIDLDK